MSSVRLGLLVQLPTKIVYPRAESYPWKLILFGIVNQSHYSGLIFQRKSHILIVVKTGLGQSVRLKIDYSFGPVFRINLIVL